jgi:hypothetical protein
MRQGCPRRRQILQPLRSRDCGGAARSGEVGILLADRFAITVRSNGVNPEALTSALKQIDLTRLASAVR